MRTVFVKDNEAMKVNYDANLLCPDKEQSDSIMSQYRDLLAIKICIVLS